MMDSNWQPARGDDPPGTRTVIHGDVNAPVLSGQFFAPVTIQNQIAAGLASAPPPPEHFTGRGQLVQTILDSLIASDAAQAITGMGGVGKSALARKVAAEAAPFFPGGIFWADLPAHGGNPAPILDSWARLCGHDPATLSPDLLARAETTRGFVAQRSSERGRVLLALDDLREEWLHGVEALRSARPDGAALLLISRDASLVADAELHPLDALPTDDGVQLLRRLAKAAVEPFPRDAVRLVRAVGGLPLALELAGRLATLRSRKPGWKLATLVDELTRRAADDVLKLPTHPGLTATFLVSYEALSADQQRAVRAIGAFAPVAMTGGMLAVALGIDAASAEGLLDSLVDLSLAQWVAGGPALRYSMHPLLEQFAGRVTEPGEREALRAPVIAALRGALSTAR